MSDGALKLNILSPERRLLEKATVEVVTITTTEGQIQILPGHAPMVGVLETGIFHYRDVAGALHQGLITTGFVEVSDEEVTLLGETLELAGEIDVERAKRAQRDAEETLKAANLEEGKFRKYQLKLDRAIIRQQVAGKEHLE